MVSLGKLSVGQERYYLEQAEDRVDVAESLNGVEEYYASGAEARGRWCGAAAAQLGLSGRVDAEDLRRLLAGSHPRTGQRLRESAPRLKVAAFDATFSAPKSVSVLFATGSVEAREEMRAAHDAAVAEALAYFERAAAVRRGHNGTVVEQVEGFVAAAFRHHSSRAGDPQLHTHVVIANLGRGSDGRWTALVGAGCTPTPRRPATSTRRCCGRS